jgi:hypothetical protein
MRKIEDVRKMVGCNGIEGAVVYTWRSKFSDADGERKMGGVSGLFINVSAALVGPCTQRGDKELAYNDSPRAVEQLHCYIQESDENNEDVLL